MKSPDLLGSTVLALLLVVEKWLRGAAVCEGTLARLLHDNLVGILGALKDLLLIHDPLIAAHARDVAKACIAWIRIVINAHDR